MQKYYAFTILLVFLGAMLFSAAQAKAADAPASPAKADNAIASPAPKSAPAPAAEQVQTKEPASFDTEVTDPKLEARIQSYNCSLKQLVDKAEKRIKCIDNELKAEENIKLAEDQIKKGDELLKQGDCAGAREAYKKALCYQNTKVMKRTVDERIKSTYAIRGARKR